jgi:rare lipoprotein A
METEGARALRLMACAALLAHGCAREPQVGAPVDVSGPESAEATAPPAFQVGIASYYARRFRGRKTANGERYDPSRLTAAHRTLPFGTLVEVRRRDGRSVVVRINDRGPYVQGRIIDLSRKAADLLGMLHDGMVEVELVPLPPGSQRD